MSVIPIIDWGFKDKKEQKYCTSCGRPIPDGQGKSCSMCYYGRDGYYREWAEDQEQKRQKEE
jgi:ribosomal protein L37E